MKLLKTVERRLKEYTNELCAHARDAYLALQATVQC